MRDKLGNILFSLFSFFVVFIISIQGLSVRHLWQDEVETAERAKSIINNDFIFKFPLVIDDKDNLSLNTLGAEVSDSKYHLYTPIVNFYIHAFFLNFFPNKPEFSLRLPSVLFHSMTSGIITYGTLTLASLSPFSSISLGVLYGLNSVRLAFNRTARYHGLNDFMFIFGLLFLFNRPILTSIILAVLIQVNPLSGFMVSGIFFFLFIFLGLIKNKHDNGRLVELSYLTLIYQIKEGIKKILIIPFFSTLLFLFMYEPWKLSRYFPYPYALDFSFLFNKIYLPYIISLVFIVFVLNKSRWIFNSSILLILLVLSGLPSSLSIFSNFRYYLWIILLPVFFVWISNKKIIQTSFVTAITLIIVEILMIHADSPYHMVRVIYNDYLWEKQGLSQPLHEAFRELEKVDGSIFVPLVPQFVNWYLGRLNPALIPDPIYKNHLFNEFEYVSEADYHLWYTSHPFNWFCQEYCDAQVLDFSIEDKNYNLKLNSHNKIIKYCIVGKWLTDHFNNSPMSLLGSGAFEPEGAHLGYLVLGRNCKD